MKVTVARIKVKGGDSSSSVRLSCGTRRLEKSTEQKNLLIAAEYLKTTSGSGSTQATECES